MSIMNKVALVIGVGDATGGAIGFATGSRKEKEVIALLDQIEACVGPIEVLVHGAGTRPARGPRTGPQALGREILEATR